MGLDAFGFEVWVVWAGGAALNPDGFDGVGCNFLLFGRFRIPERLGLGHAANVGHFLGVGQLAANIRSPC